MTTFHEVANSTLESAGHRFVDPKVPTILRLGDFPMPDRLPPLPFSAACRTREALRAEVFPNGAEAAVSCARPAGPGSFRQEDARYVQDVRRFTATTLRRWRVELSVAPSAELVASELFTNELVHGASNVIRVQLIAGAGTFTLAVSGGGPYVPVYPMADPNDRDRRGLSIVDHLAHLHGGYWGRTADGTTWCLMGSAAWRAAA
ncbi:ATP-binding protein [Streptomyces goshikiensis]|uniref:ATP-binding protein n=1 Tax=Streptomyces goshikiensis TaxID=1942 RepID=UPI0037A88219